MAPLPRLQRGVLRPLLRPLALLLGAALLAAAPARGASYDPDLTWRTLETEHFRIHFHQGIEQVADEFSGMVEDVYDEMSEEMAWQPRPKIEVVLVDRTDSANGFARTVPYPSITIYVTAPTGGSTLNLYEDWNSAIFTHELTHVLHMDTNHAIVSAARAVVGRIASTNDISPWWMVEGLATFQETRHTAAGRGRASWPDMIKRTSVVEDDFPPLGNLDGLQPEPPSGNLRYLFGQDFIDHVAFHHGEDVWTRWTHLYGGRIPYWLPGKQAFGERFRPMYEAWKADTIAAYTAQADAVRAEGETIGRLVSLSDPEASCSAPAFSPDGEKLVWSCYDLRTGSSIWMSDGEGYAPEKILQDRGASYFTWRADSQAFVYAGTHVVNRFNYWSDIYLHVLDGGTTALTTGARARDPDFSPDGTKLLYVTNRAQDNQLEISTVDRRRHRLTDNHDHTQYDTPRFSPDGRAVALSVWQQGRRDLWLYSPEGELLRRLTADVAIETDPVWSADGRWLYFVSDRTGIPNVFAVELATEKLFQITNVVTGAVRPSVHPDGTRIAYQQYSRDGWDIRVLDLKPERFLDRGSLPALARWPTPLRDLVGPPATAADAEVVAAWSGDEPAKERHGILGELPFLPSVAQTPAPTEVLDSFDAPDIVDAFGEEQDYDFRITPKRYNPLRTLTPRYVIPLINTTPFRSSFCAPSAPFCPGLQGTLGTSATDALSRYSWSAQINYRTDADFLGGGASFTINRWLPVYSFGASTRAVPAAQLAFTGPGGTTTGEGAPALFVTEPPSIYWERRSAAAATVAWPYRYRESVFAQYSITQRINLDALPENVYEPLIPLRGYVGALSGGWRYAWSQPTSYAISAEDARTASVVGRLLAPWLGSYRQDASGRLVPFTQVQLTGDVSEYVVNPLIPNHVLAMRAGAGATFGGSEVLGNYYQLGGSFGDGGFTVTPDEFRMLRGYPIGSDFGDLFWLGSIEYRLPIAQINRGVGMWPGFLRNVSASGFVDAGNAFQNPGAVTPQQLLSAAGTDPLVGVGGEILVRGTVLWAMSLTGRFGYGVGLLGERRLDPAVDPLAPFYARLGGSF